ncbi:SDR family oxidoreductase [Marinococcus halotolerans]|uniref:SDR family oxidoreductase n=1 Tax=Marinococcus halotolerans TaxID=301092 RepID=UPI0003B43129|nr:SDR family oxidoreductase [Marinococcus halotolerans]
MDVLVIGANGHTGRLLVEQLAAHPEHTPHAMVRAVSQADELKKLGASSTILADLEENPASALKGMDAVMFAAGSGSSTGPEKTVSVDQQGAKKTIDAARVQDVQHYVMLSGIGVDNPQGSIKHYAEAKLNADKHLQSSGLPYTIVRPGRLTFDKGTGKIELAEKLSSPEQRDISREDVARTMIAALDIENARGQTVELLAGEMDIHEAWKAL